MDEGAYEIRELRDDDFDAFSELQSRTYPEHPVSADELRYFLGMTRGEGRVPLHLATLARATGQLVGVAMLDQVPFRYHPKKYWCNVLVDSRHRDQGLGSELFSRLESEARRRDAWLLWAQVRAEGGPGMRFFEKHGFREVRRMRQSRLVLAEHPPDALPDRTREFEADGVQFTALADEGPERDEVRRRYFRLHEAASEGMPGVGEVSKLSFEEFVRVEFDDPRFFPEGTLFARKGDEYVGVTSLSPEPGRPKVVHIGFTGTDPRFRGRGVATELKRRSIAFARARGFESIETGNDYDNPRIWAINEKLGFRTFRTFVTGERILSGKA